MAIISEFYKRLRDLCEERNMTVNELVKILELSSGSPTAWKNGTIPREATLAKIAVYFDVPVEFLLTGELPNGFCFPDDENPHTLELCDAFETLPIDDQIHVKNWVVSYAADPEKAKKSPDQLVLTEGEEKLIQLFRQVPQDRQAMVIQMIEAALKNL